MHGGVAVVDGLGDCRPRAFCGRVEVEWRWEVSGGKGAEKGQKGTADLGWCRSRYGMRGEEERASGRGRKSTHCICGERRMDRA